MDSSSPDAIRELVDHESGLVDRAIFAGQAIYKAELAQIFGRCWLFLAHESQLPRNASFVTARAGEEPVIVCRGEDAQVRALLNICPACTGPVCQADEGSTTDFICPNHAWRFDLAGRAIADADDQPVSSWDLDAMPRVASYKGWIFGSWDADAPDLETYLGDIRWGLDLLIEQADLVVGSVTRWLIDCNWKFAAEGSVNDIYHGVSPTSGIFGEATASADAVGLDSKRRGFTILTEYGHGLNAELVDDQDPRRVSFPWRSDAVVRRRLGSFRMQVIKGWVTVFPNLAVSTATRQVRIWQPRGPSQTEVWLLQFVNPDQAPEERKLYSRIRVHFGPNGLIEQDDAENWVQATAASRGPLSLPRLNYQMGLGHGKIVDDERSPPRIESLINEHRELWFYRNWAEAMAAHDWPDWRQHCPVPEDTV